MFVCFMHYVGEGGIVVFKGTFHENQMHAKVYIVIPIEKQILSALRNHFPFPDGTSQRQDLEKNIWTDFNFNTLLFVCFVVGEQRLQIFVIVHWLVVASIDGFVACRS